MAETTWGLPLWRRQLAQAIDTLQRIEAANRRRTLADELALELGHRVDRTPMLASGGGPAARGRSEPVFEPLAKADDGTITVVDADPGKPPADVSPQALARALHARLIEQLTATWRELQVQSLIGTASAGGPGKPSRDAQARAHRGALYAIAALLDERLLIDLDWPGRQAWLECLLERRLFKTRLSGQRFFELAEHVLAGAPQGPDDDTRRELAALLLLLLPLGFKGAHRGETGRAALESLRGRLHRLAVPAPESDSPSADTGRVLFAQAYAHTLDSPGDANDAGPKGPRWRHLVVAVAAWLAGSGLLWWWLMQPLAALASGGPAGLGG